MGIAFWKNKKVLITGGYGFLGKVVSEKLFQKGLPKKQLIRFDINDYDLRKENDVERLFNLNQEIDVVFHLAADVGGIGHNRNYPGSVIYNNTLMNTLVTEYSRLAGVEKFVGVGSVCSYPKYTSLPFKEENLWNGYPEETNASYGLAKKLMLVQGQAYRQQYGFNAIHLLMINLYGPGDNFDLKSSHVVSALIRKCVEAERSGYDKIEVWGSGKASREFLYVEDAAHGVILAAEHYDGPEPVNLGSGREITIKELVAIIVHLSGFKGDVVWNPSKPDGQPRRCLDVNRAKDRFGFEAKMTLEQGLQKTIEWYREQPQEFDFNMYHGSKDSDHSHQLSTDMRCIV